MQTKASSRIATRMIAALLSALLLVGALPAQALAYVGAVAPPDSHNSVTRVSATQSDQSLLLKNDYISFKLDSGGFGATYPTYLGNSGIATKGDSYFSSPTFHTPGGSWLEARTVSVHQSDDVQDFLQQRIDAYDVSNYPAGTANSSQLSPLLESPVIANYDGPIVYADYTFSGAYQNVTATLCYLLVNVGTGSTSEGLSLPVTHNPNDVQTWGVLTLVLVDDRRSSGFSMDDNGSLTSRMNLFGFNFMGHSGAAANTAAVYMSSYDLDSNASSSTNISGGLPRTDTSGWSSSAITEVYTDCFGYANPFAATSEIYGYGYDGGQAFEGYGSALRMADRITYQAGKAYDAESDVINYNSDVLTLESYLPEWGGDAFCSQLWGFRDLVNSSFEGEKPSETEFNKVTLHDDADRLAVYATEGGVTVLPVEGLAGLTAASAQKGKQPLAVLRGTFVKENGAYVFQNGYAALSPSVSATWSESGGRFAVREDGTIEHDGVALSCPSFKFYQAASNDAVEFVWSDEADAQGLALAFDPSKNTAVISIDIPFATTKLENALIAADGNLTFDGDVSFSALFKGAALQMEKLGYGLDAQGDFTVNGVKASGSIDTGTLIGLELASIEGSINTFPNLPAGEDAYHFTMELDVYGLFEAEAELGLARTKSNGLIPDDLYFYINSEVGVPLVTPIVVGELTGGGAGFYDLASTIKGDFIAIPPVRLRGTATAKLLHTVEGTADFVIGPSIYSETFRDIKLSGTGKLKLLDSLSRWFELSGQTRSYQGTTYTGLYMGGGFSMAGSFPSKEKDWIVLEGSLQAGGFGGLNAGKTQLYVNVGGNAKVSGKIQTPSSFPPLLANRTILGGTIEVALGLQTVATLNQGTTAAIKSAFSNIDLYGGVAATASVLGSGVRAYYIIPDDYGFSFRLFREYDDFDWDEHGVNVMALADDEGQQVGLIIAETGLEDLDVTPSNAGDAPALVASGVASSSVGTASPLGAGDTLPYGAGGTTLQPLGSTNYDIDATGYTVDDVAYLDIIPTDASQLDALKGDLAVTVDGMPLALSWLPATGDIQSGASHNAAVVEDDNGAPHIAVRVGAGGGRLAVNVSSATDYTVRGSISRPFATLDAALAGSNLSGTILNPEKDAQNADKHYVLRTYYGLEQGGTDYLVDQSEVPNNALPTSVALPTSGELVPSGSYYVTTYLMETVAGDFDGDGTAGADEKTWLTVDSAQFDDAQKLTYANVFQPAPVSNVALEAAGNETLVGSWTGTANADGYRVTVYEQNADTGTFEDTGVGYEYAADAFSAASASHVEGLSTTGSTFSLNMALTTGGAAEDHGTPIVLEAGKTYRIGVQPYRNKALALDDATQDLAVYGDEARSNGALLPAYVPVDMKVLVNWNEIALKEGSAIYEASVGVGNAEGNNILALSSADPTQQASYVVTRMDDQSVLPRVDECYVLPAFEGSAMFRLQASVTHDGVTDTTSRFLLVNHDTTAPVITLDQDTFDVDPATGAFRVTGVADPGSAISLSNSLAATTAASDGTFAIEDSLDLAALAVAAEGSQGGDTATPSATVEGGQGGNLAMRAAATEGGPVGGVVNVQATDAGGNQAVAVAALVVPTALSTFHVTYAANAADATGTVPADDNAYVTAASAAVRDVGTLARAGHAFAGWNTQPDGQGTSFAAGTQAVIAGDLVLYAQWRPLGSDPSTPGGEAGPGGTGTPTSPMAATGDGSLAPLCVLLAGGAALAIAVSRSRHRTRRSRRS